MPAADPVKLSVHQLAERFRREMIPLSKTFSYFSAAVPLSEEEIREYLQEPIAALPPSIAAKLPKISILLVPYLERAQGRDRKSCEMVSMDKPSESKVSWSAKVVLSKDEAVLAFALKDQEVADYHYRLYQLLASLMADHWTDDIRKQYYALMWDELLMKVHGEVDDASWQLKQALLPTLRPVRRETNSFKAYARQSFIDTLTLYLHGICCDIDVETGPRQLPSRYLRRRLELLEKLYPPPHGYSVFPEESKRRK
jgi:hypothetical protein